MSSRKSLTTLAGIAAAATLGIALNGLDVTAQPDDESAATAIEYGLIAANSVQARGLTFNFLD